MKILTTIYFLFTFSLLAQNALVWYPGGNASGSASAVQQALADNSIAATTTTSLSALTASTPYLFICLGVYPNNYVLDADDDADVQKIIDYFQQGGRVYMEGGDTWAWDFPTALQSWFNLYGEADGEADLQTIYGAAAFSNTSFSYGGSQQHIDHLAPLNDAFVIFTNNQPAFACGVASDTDGYRAIGVSFEFGGLTNGIDTRADLMNTILGFFDTGYSGSKPAPLSVTAFNNYDNAIPLVWDAPPGQRSLSMNQQQVPALTISQKHAAVHRPPTSGRTRESSNQGVALAKIAAVGFQADSYNIYRSTDANGAFTKIASNIERQYYRDEFVTNGTTYYYYIKAVYDGQEGEASLTTSALPSAQNSATSPWKFITPSIDGHIEADEWSNAAEMNITAPGQSQTATLYIFNDDDYFYVAVDETANAALNTDDQLGLNFDRNNDFEWPAGLLEEGTYWFSWNGSSTENLFRGLNGHWPLNIDWADPVTGAGLTSAVSATSGNVQYEGRIDMANSTLTINAGDRFGMYLYALDMPDSTFTASWPAEVTNAGWSNAWSIPALYGAVHTSAKEACPWISDDEHVANAATFNFNEFGDGRRLDISMTTISGQGRVTVKQTNGCVTNPINNNYINCTWLLSKESSLTAFTADITFRFNAADVANLDKSKLQVHRWTGSTWQYEGGVVSASENSITFSTNFLGEFALFERERVLLSLNAFLEGAYENGGTMRTSLKDNGHIPLTSPYSDARILGTVPTSITDWIQVELRSTPDDAAVAQRSFLLKSTNPAVDWDGNETTLRLPDAVDGAYYVVLKHRNHVPVMSANPITLNSASTTTIDFTNALGSYYQSHAKLLETGVYGLYAGDANGNGHIQNDDKNDFWKVQYESTGYKNADFNLDAQVLTDDRDNFWQPNSGQSSRVP